MRAAVWHNRRDVRIEEVRRSSLASEGAGAGQGVVVRNLRDGSARIPRRPDIYPGYAPPPADRSSGARDHWPRNVGRSGGGGRGSGGLCCGRPRSGVSHHRLRNLPLVPLGIDGAVRSRGVPGNLLERRRACRASEPQQLTSAITCPKPSPTKPERWWNHSRRWFARSIAALPALTTSVAVVGAGPMGLMTIMAARIFGVQTSGGV